MQLCDATFPTSEKPVFQYSSSSSIVLLQVQSVQSFLCSLQSELSTSASNSLAVCCSVFLHSVSHLQTLSSILQQLLTIRQYMTSSISTPFHILNKDYCIRFLVPFSPLFHSQIREGQLQTEVVQFAKHSKNAPEITIDGKLYSVVQRVKVWMSHSNHG